MITPKNYRADIDGLRAIAILSVVVFHAFPNVLRGGFIGVDIFFVISGFLISSIIFKNLEAGTFSFSDFYIKRVRRIFPSLLTVLLISLLVGWRVLLSDEFQQLGKHTLAGGAFVINFVLKKEVGYFDTAVELKPLLHLWSLAIEEQFYIIWPALLWLAWKRKISLIKIAVFVFIISFARNVYMVSKHPTYTFYMLDTRLWELVAGALLAYLKLYGKPIKYIATKQIASTVGIALIIIGVILIDKNKAFPGVWALFPVGGAVLLIFAGKDAWFNRYILSSKPMVWIGLISYPLYLWHWPVLSFATIMQQDQHRLFLVLLSFVLAWLTYQFVEKPIRFKTQPRYIYGLCVAMVGTIAFGFLINLQLIKNQSYDLDHQVVEAKKDWKYPETNAQIKGRDIHNLGVTSSKKNILFVGDSHIANYYPRMAYLESKGMPSKVSFLLEKGCSILVGWKMDSYTRDCYMPANKFIEMVKDEGFDTVVIENSWDGYFLWKKVYFDDENGVRHFGGTEEGKQNALKRISALLAGLKKQNIKVYLNLNTPHSNFYDPSYMFQRSFSRGIEYKPRDFMRNSLSKNQVLLGEDLSKIAIENGAVVINPFDYLCDETKCKTTIDGLPIYIDSNHFRASFARDHIKYLDEIVM